MSKTKLYHDLETQTDILLAHNGLVVLKLTETLTTPVYKQLNDELLRLKDVVAITLTATGAELTDQERLSVIEVMTKASNLSLQLVE